MSNKPESPYERWVDRSEAAWAVRAATAQPLSKHILETARSPWKPGPPQTVEECDAAWLAWIEHEVIEIAALERQLDKAVAWFEGDDCPRARLEWRLAAMREALIGHRKDLHQYSRRACPTCRKSAKALGIDKLVPDSCAYYEEDVDAILRKAAGGTNGDGISSPPAG